MSPFALWAIVSLGLGVVLVRQRTFAVGLVSLEALVLVAVAAAHADTPGEVVAAIALGARAGGLAVLFYVLAAKTQEPRPVRAGTGPLVRAVAATLLALALTWLVPHVGLGSRQAERAVVALVAFGLVTVATRRALLLQVVGIVLVENGLALAAIELPRAGATVVELGVALDLTLIALVAFALHLRIFSETGTANSALLQELRD